MIDPIFADWDAYAFFERLVRNNKLARELGMQTFRVASLRGFEEALNSIQECTAFCCVSDSSEGELTLAASPATHRFKEVYFAIRHENGDIEARMNVMRKIRELFRQFMTVLIRERTRLECNAVYMDQKIPFHEISQYFASGCACAFFQIYLSFPEDLRYKESDWEQKLI